MVAEDTESKEAPLLEKQKDQSPGTGFFSPRDRYHAANNRIRKTGGKVKAMNNGKLVDIKDKQILK